MARYVRFICTHVCLSFLRLLPSNWYVCALYKFSYRVEFIQSFYWYVLFNNVQEISKVTEAISVANNACWAIGELAVKVC